MSEKIGQFKIFILNFMKKKVILYKKENWEIPIEIFFDELKVKNNQLLAKILSKIDLLSLDLLWNEEVKYLEDKIYELRVKKQSNISRIFYFTIQGNNIILLDWIIKKDQKLKRNILDKMINYKNNFLNRN